MEHLNYCRDLIKKCMDRLNQPSLSSHEREAATNAIDLATASQKFILPEGGWFLDDFRFKALDDDLPINLPFPNVALEFRPNRHPDVPLDDPERVSAFIIFGRIWEDELVLTTVSRYATDGVWAFCGSIKLPRTGYLDRTQESDTVPIRGITESGSTATRVSATRFLGFLNALACSNVHIDSSQPKKAGKKIKSALPFDTYHVLTIDVPGKTGDGTGAASGGHRSPREHLRRGHIRRLADGRRIWVNATVVSAGRGGGVVKKDYAVRAAGELAQ